VPAIGVSRYPYVLPKFDTVGSLLSKHQRHISPVAATTTDLSTKGKVKAEMGVMRHRIAGHKATYTPCARQTYT